MNRDDFLNKLSQSRERFERESKTKQDTPRPRQPQQPQHVEKRATKKSTQRIVPIQDTMPHSVEAEQGVLSSMLQPHDGSEAIEEAMANLGRQHFCVPAHRTIFIAICDLFDSGQVVDMITLTQSLRDKKSLDQVGGVGFITDLQTFVPTAAAVGHYINIVREKYVLRSIVFAGSESVRRAQQQQIDVAETLDFVKERFDAINLNGAIDNLPAPTSIVALAEKDPAVFESDNLLGNRFLCREGIMFEIAPSDAGKSSSGIQQDVCWALGRVAFGIKPPRPLRMLTAQAENDDGDLAEMTRGICDHLGLSAEERALVRERVIYIKEKSLTGEAFLRRLRRLIRKYKPDIVRLDPLHAYAGGDVTNSNVASAFLRNGLNPILEEFHCAAIIMHHTPKTTYRDTSQWSASDWMYAMAGAADLTNCARAILVIDPTKVVGTYLFRAAKRGRRIGWADENGHRVYDRVFCHNEGDAIFWRDATEDDLERVRLAKAKKGEALQTKEELLALVPLDEPFPKEALLSRAVLKGFGINHAKRLLSVLIADKELHELRKPRKGTRPEILISRREETLI
jgi:hypothetical protein